MADIRTAFLAGITAGALCASAVWGFELEDPFAQPGQVLRICCPDQDFEQLMSRYYPEYHSEEEFAEVSGGTLEKHGKVGDTETIFVIPGGDYEEYLDGFLLDSESIDPDARIDLFIVRSEDAEKYCSLDPEVTLTLEDLGFDEESVDQFAFTREIVSDEDGFQRASTWQVPCGVLMYRRSAARIALGTDDPEEAGNMLSSWDLVLETAEKLRSCGYLLFAGPDEAYDSFIGGSGSWVDENGVIDIDGSAAAWVDFMSVCREKGYVGDEAVSSDEHTRKSILSGASAVFACFVTPSEISSLFFKDDDYPRLVSYGDWAVCKGPGCFVRGGEWIAAAAGTDNEEMAADIMRTLTGDGSVMRQMTLDTGMLTNNTDAMAELSGDESYANALFSGQNDIQVFRDAAEGCVCPALSGEDMVISQIFHDAYLPYLEGRIKENEALENFYDMVLKKFPFYAEG